MNLPHQSQPVMRNVSSAAFSGGMETSGMGCNITCSACNRLSGFPAQICKATASAAGCSC